MAFKFNIFTSNFDLVEGESPFWLDPVPTRGDLPSGVADGAAINVLDEESIFVYDLVTDEWYNTRLSLTQFDATTNPEGISIETVQTANVNDFRINLHPASSTTPGGVSIGAQNFAGNKTFDNDVTITGNLTVNGTTTTVNSTTLDVTDANITINNNGDQATADLNDAGLTIEMSDATDVVFGYDSTLTSRMKLGDLGDEREVVTVSHSQTITNKNLKDTSNLLSGASADNFVRETGNQSNFLIPDSASDDTFVLEAFAQDITNKTLLEVDNLRLDGNTLSTTDTNGNLLLSPDGTGDTRIVNGRLLPENSLTQNLGDNSNRWNELHTDDIFLNTRLRDNNGRYRLEPALGLPSGASTALTIRTESDGGNLGLHTLNKSGTTVTGAVILESGNQTGTVDSGNIELRTGTSTVTRGDIVLDANQVDVSSTNIVNVLDPVNNQDAATKVYVDTGLATKADRDLNNLTGPTLITVNLQPSVPGVNLGDSGASTTWNRLYVNFLRTSTGENVIDVANRVLESPAGNNSIDWSSDTEVLAGLPLNMGTNQITDVVDPTNDQDAATKVYVDDNTTFVVGDLDQVSFSITNNQAVFADVTGVAFANGVTRSAELHYSVNIDADTDLYESGQIQLIQKGASWEISQGSIVGDNSQILFDITPAGQLQYQSADYTGFVSGTLKVRAITTSV